MSVKTLREFFPTWFDHSPAAFLEDQADWIVAPCLQTRDSDALERSNFAAQDSAISQADPNGDDYETHRFGHWGPGWYEIVIVRPGSAAHVECEQIADRLDQDAVLNEKLFSEYEAADE